MSHLSDVRSSRKREHISNSRKGSFDSTFFFWAIPNAISIKEELTVDSFPRFRKFPFIVKKMHAAKNNSKRKRRWVFRGITADAQALGVNRNTLYRTLKGEWNLPGLTRRYFLLKENQQIKTNSLKKI